MNTATADSQLLFGVLALRARLLSETQFARACTAWIGQSDTPFADLLVERGFLSDADRKKVECFVDGCIEGGFDVGVPTLEAALPKPPTVAFSESAALHFGMSPSLSCPEEGRSPERGRSRQAYSLLRLHDTGGVGRVWVARDNDLGREVALKELRPDRAESVSASDRFLREAKITSQLEHPAIVPVYELADNTPDGTPFYTMRFVRGRTLAEAVRDYHKKKRGVSVTALELRELLNALVGVSNAIAYAHSRHVLHRDVKPHNLVLGDFGEVVVLDWGMAKVLGTATGAKESRSIAVDQPAAPAQTLEGQILGTPAYMSPEQAQGQSDLDERTDIYGLGAVLYEILTGQAPFTGSSTREILDKVIAKRPLTPVEITAGTSRTLSAICMKALAKDRTERYATAQEFARDLERWLAGEPVTAYAEPWSARARRWVGQHRTLTTATGAALLVALASLAAATIFLKAANNRERLARQEAELAQREAASGFSMALKLIDQGFVKVSDHQELKAKGLEPVRKDLLEQAANFYDQLNMKRGHDPAIRFGNAQARLRLANLTAEMGDRQAAVVQAVYAKNVLDDLARTEPDNYFYQQERIYALLAIADNSCEPGQIKECGSSLAQALAISEALVAERPECPFSRHLLAMSLNSLGQYYQKALNDLDRANETLVRARETCEWLVERYPDNTEYQQTLVRALTYYGSVNFSDQKRPRARESLEAALALSERLVKEHPGVPSYEDQLAFILHGLSTFYSNARQPDRVKAVCKRALPLFERLVHEHPAVPAYQQGLLTTRVSLALSTALEGDHRGAALAAEEATAKLPKAGTGNMLHGLTYYNTACVFCLCAVAVQRDATLDSTKRASLLEDYLRRAMTALEAAEKSGDFTAGRIRDLKKDPDLEILRDRNVFKEFVRKVEAKMHSTGSEAAR